MTKLELHVFPWNEPALRLYESFGFEREGYRKPHYARDDELVDAILMAYLIDDVRSAGRRAPPSLGAEIGTLSARFAHHT